MLIKDLIENESNEQQLNIILDPEIYMKNRLKERHFLEEIQDGRRNCYISDRTIKSIRTYYQCKFCKIALCPIKCFEIFHTKKDSYK